MRLCAWTGILASTILSLSLMLQQSCSAVLRLCASGGGGSARGALTCTGSCLREGQGARREASIVIVEGMGQSTESYKQASKSRALRARSRWRRRRQTARTTCVACTVLVWLIGTENVVRSFGSSENPTPTPGKLPQWRYGAARLWRMHPKPTCERSEYNCSNRSGGHQGSCGLKSSLSQC